MTHKLIKTDNYILVVDDSEINRGEWFYNPVSNHTGINYSPDGCKKIIAHLPLNGLPILEGVDLLPPYSRHQEDGLKELAEINYPIGDWTEEQCLVRRLAFKTGYNKAREKYKYTEEDMRKALLIKHDGLNADYVIEVISNKYPTEFECEMKYFEVDMGLGEECIEHGQIPQKITTAQGVQWVGKYK